MQSFIWISYDLGVTGDYEGLYTWLDDHDAKECGNSVACFSFCYDGDLFESLKTEIEEAVLLNKRSRIYIICMQEGETRGRFIIGRRKSAPWSGYGTYAEYVDDLGF